MSRIRASLPLLLERLLFTPCYPRLRTNRNLSPREQTSLTIPQSSWDNGIYFFWLGLTLAFALGYGLLALFQALNGDYVVQDDARQHVFWMARFLDSTLFPNDVIADYFQSVAPSGYQLVYRLAAWLGVSPLLFHKFLPLGLTVMTAALCFRVSLSLFALPSAAFCSSVLLGQGLGLTDAIVSGTPKAFIYPLFLLFLEGLLQRSWTITWVGIALEGLFYPQLVLISAGILCLRMVEWQGGMTFQWRKGRDRLLCLGGLTIAFGVLLPYALQTSVFGPTLTLADARQLPELAMEGSRSRFFYDGEPGTYWLKGRSGLRLATILTPVTNVLGLGLLALLWRPHHALLSRNGSHSWTANSFLLLQSVVASLACFFAAHLLLFRLHLPSRYTQHSLRVAASLAAGIVIICLLYSLWQQFIMQATTVMAWIKKVGAGAIAVLIISLVLGYPLWVGDFPLTGYQYGTHPKLYSFLQSQPKTAVVASISNEVNNLPTFAQRSILTGSEYAIPYHMGYYETLRARTIELIQAQYSSEKKVVQAFVKEYGVTLWLLDKAAFRPRYLQNNAVIQQYPQAALAVASSLQNKKRPILLRRLQACQVFEDDSLILIDPQCLR